MVDVPDGSTMSDGNEVPRSESRALVVRSGATWRAVKVFSGPLVVGPNPLGDQLTEWLLRSSSVPVEVVVAQSGAGDAGCFSFVVFHRPHPGAP